MSRTYDVSMAIEEIKKLNMPNVDTYKEIELALLGHIAVALAVIADNMETAKGAKNEQEIRD